MVHLLVLQECGCLGMINDGEYYGREVTGCHVLQTQPLINLNTFIVQVIIFPDGILMITIKCMMAAVLASEEP
jgi:hypothetical protein